MAMTLEQFTERFNDLSTCATISLFAQEAMVGTASRFREGLCHTGQGVR